MQLLSFTAHHRDTIEHLYLKKAIVSVINDLATDQRVHKSCLALQKTGFEVLLIGRVLASSPAMPARSYRFHRMKLLFSKGPLFYAEYNLRLFLFLLFRKADVLLSNDLDTLLANYLVSKLKSSKLIFDSHEYFTETPELVGRKKVQYIWKSIERWIVPQLKEMITVNASIADLFATEYGIKVHVIRNIPPRYIPHKTLNRKELQLPEDKKILILQGAGINVDRGAEELVEAMAFLPNCFLLIIGGGDVLLTLQHAVERLQLQDRLRFLSRMPYLEMMQYTQCADLGLTLDKDSNLNYRFSLPNKLFDYLHAGVPVLASPLPEIKKIIDTYQIGTFIVNHQPQTLAKNISDALGNALQMENWRANCNKASLELCWENEERKLLKIYADYC